MQQTLYALLLALMVACKPTTVQQQTAPPPAVIMDTTVTDVPVVSHITREEEQHPETDALEDSLRMTGRFFSQDHEDTGYIVLTGKTEHVFSEDEEGDDHADAVFYHYSLHFRKDSVTTFPDFGGANINVINEGDLDNDGKDEIAVFWMQLTMCYGNVTIYSYKNDKWVVLTEEGFGGCHYSRDYFVSMIYKTDSTAWFLEPRENVATKLVFRK